MKNQTRMSRVNDEIFKEVSQIIRGELKDPRIGAMTSVVRVETTQDLKYCKIYVSVLGDAGGGAGQSAVDTGIEF